MQMGIGRHKRCEVGGFTRPDATMIIGMAFLLGMLAWLGIAATGEKRRTLLCAHRMKMLGRAFGDYAKDHNDMLPPAVFEDGRNSTSWDREIAVYLSPALGRQHLPEKQTALEAEVASSFK